MKRSPVAVTILALLCLVATAFFYVASHTPKAAQEARAEVPATETRARESQAPLVAGANSAATAPAVLAKPARPLFAISAPATGQALDERSPEFAQAYLRGGTPVGRIAVVDKQSLAALADVRKGDRVQIPLIDGRMAEGTVNYANTDRSVRRVAGELTGEQGGSFNIGFDGQTVGGLILLPSIRRAYELVPENDGTLQIVERPSKDVVCEPIPKSPFPQAIAAKDQASQVIPLLNSRPTAVCQIYLDFDGETVTDPSWDSGRTIVAPPYNLSNTTIINIFNRVKEDWWPFNINITTDVTKYNDAPVGKRMRCIVTSNDQAAQGAGGVAYLDSFRRAGTGSFSSNIPCWVFNSDEIGISEAISHEVGHTFNLGHDGRTTPKEEYYLGQGSGATSWCPIMGAGYYVNVTQWSKGEYANASNTQDDLYEISRRIGAAIGGTASGYMPDDAGNTRSSAPLLAADAADGSVLQEGVIEKTADVDYYTFTTSAGGSINLTGRGAPRGPNLDLSMTLYDKSGVEIALGANGNPGNALNSTLTGTLPAGDIYYLKVTSSGALDPVTTGYSDYASLGAYTISGNITNLTRRPIITSSSTATGQVGMPFSYTITASGNAAAYSVVDDPDLHKVLPDGLTVNTTTGVISGIPKVEGLFQFTVLAHNASGDGTKVVNLTVAPPALTMGQALDLESVTWVVDPVNPWLARTNVSFDGVDAAQTGSLPDGGKTTLSATITGPAAISFYWKVSSELNGDFLAFQVDGVDAGGPAVPISGDVNWTQVSVPIPEGSHQVSWVYRKNDSVADGTDQAFVDKVIITTGNAPVITSAASASGVVGNKFSYQILASGYPNEYKVTGTLPAGLKLNASSGLITGVPAIAGSTSVTLEATNRKSSTEALSGNLNVAINIAASTVTLADATDSTGITWATSASPTTSAKWFPENVVTHDDTDALQAGPINRNEQSILQGTLSTTGTRTVTFFWKTESEANDRLSFQVNSVEYATLSGTTDWQSPAFAVPANAVLKWVYQKDGAVDGGRDTAWLDQVVVTTDVRPVITSVLTATARAEQSFSYQIIANNGPTFFDAVNLPKGLVVDSSSGLISGTPVTAGRAEIKISAGNRAGASEPLTLVINILPSLRDAVDLTDRPFTTTSSAGSEGWFAQLTQTTDREDAAQSGVTLDNGTSTLSAAVTGPIDVKFFWKVSSEPDRDELKFQVDGALRSSISGERDWSARTFTIPAGPHTISWTYQKDASFKSGADAGWVDVVTLSAGSNVPAIISPLKANAFLGRSFIYQIAASNSPDGYEATNLPPNFTFNAATGTITGAATSPGRFNIALVARNAAGKGTAVLELALVPEPAGTDSPDNATGLTGSLVSVVGTNDFATADPGESTHGGRPARASVWYSWKAPSTGQVLVTTAGSEFDTTLSVYTHPDGRPAMTYENDDAGKLSTSAVKVPVSAGDVLLIAVDSLDGRTGKVVLNIGYAGKGTYTGLATDENSVADPGLVTLTLSDKLAYTGSFLLDGKKYSLKGAFTGADSIGSSGKGSGIITFALHLALDAGAQEVTGTVAAGGITYNVLAKLSMVGVDVPVAVQTPFTFLIEQNNLAPGTPEGKGYGTVNIDKKGTLKAVGVLGDGTKFSSARPLALDKSAVIYLTPYKNGGVVAGSLKVDQGGAFAPLSSAINWHKLADPKAALFPAGFLSSTTLRGYRHNPSQVPLLQMNSETPSSTTLAELTFSAADASVAPAPLAVTVQANNQVSVPPGTKLTIDSKTGLFSGSFTPAGGGKPKAFAGALINGTSTTQDSSGNVQVVKISRGGGLYVANQTTGEVQLNATAPPQ